MKPALSLLVFLVEPICQRKTGPDECACLSGLCADEYNTVDSFSSHLAHMLHHRKPFAISRLCMLCIITCSTECNTKRTIMCSSVCHIICDKNMVSMCQHMAQSVQQCRLAWLVTLHYDSCHATHSITASIHISKPSSIPVTAVAACLRHVLAHTLGQTLDQGLGLLAVPEFCLHLRCCETSSDR